MAALRDWPEGRVGFDGRFPRLKSWAEWREDKGGLGRFIAPRGGYDSAQRFNPDHYTHRPGFK